MIDVQLRAVEPADLEYFFQYESEPEGRIRAGWPERDRDTFMNHWKTRVLGNPEVFKSTVLADGEVAGNIGAWEQDGRWMVGYWYGQRFWGKGIGSRGLSLFLAEVTKRPMYAETVETNAGSQRLLERCGFTRTDGDEEGFAVYVLA